MKKGRFTSTLPGIPSAYSLVDVLFLLRIMVGIMMKMMMMMIDW